MYSDLKTRVEKVIDRTCYVVNGENVSNLVKDLYAALDSEIVVFKLIATQRDEFMAYNQRLEAQNAELRQDNAILKCLPEMVAQKVAETLTKSLAAKRDQNG